MSEMSIADADWRDGMLSRETKVGTKPTREEVIAWLMTEVATDKEMLAGFLREQRGGTLVESIRSSIACAQAAIDLLAPTDTDAYIEMLRTALEASCHEDPMIQDEQGGCVWCGASGKKGSLYPPKPKDHYPDCGWLAGRKALSTPPPPLKLRLMSEAPKEGWFVLYYKTINPHTAPFAVIGSEAGDHFKTAYGDIWFSLGNPACVGWLPLPECQP